MGALAGGGGARETAALGVFARNLGLAFQYEDDLLDGDDGAFSSLAALGREEVKRRVAEHTSAALRVAEKLPGDAKFLMELANRLAVRRR